MLVMTDKVEFLDWLISLHNAAFRYPARWD